MQKVVNVVALLSGLVSLSVVGGGSYLYLNKDNIIDGVKAQIMAAATESFTESLPAILDSSVPEIPKTTGPAIPIF